MWTYDGSLLIAPLGTKFSKIVTKHNDFEENAFESDVGEMVDIFLGFTLFKQLLGKWEDNWHISNVYHFTTTAKQSLLAPCMCISPQIHWELTTTFPFDWLNATDTPFNGPLTRCVNLRVANAPGMPGTFSPPLTSKETLVSDPGMHHGTCVTHVPWYMSGSLSHENVPDIPGAGATRNFTYLVKEAHRGCFLLCLYKEPSVVCANQLFSLSYLLHAC